MLYSSIQIRMPRTRNLFHFNHSSFLVADETLDFPKFQSAPAVVLTRDKKMCFLNRFQNVNKWLFLRT
jgi:hypothetical protein